MPKFDDLIAYLYEKCPDGYNLVKEHIDAFAEKSYQEYKQNQADGKITWGKYKGYTVKELNMTDKGKSYLQWMMGQDWVKQNKPHVIDEIKGLGIRPKTFKRVPLE